MLVDLHTHCEYSPDSQAKLEEMLHTAQKRGIGVYAVTDHVELCHPWEDQCLTELLPAGHAAIAAAKKKASLRLLAGIELGQPIQAPEKSEAILSKYDFDFVIGSLHSPAGYGDFYYISQSSVTDDELFELMRRYYDELLRMAQWGKFDTLAHITYPYRYLNDIKKQRGLSIRPEQFDREAEAVLTALAERELALELNLHSIILTPEDAALNERYFRRFYELGGRHVTIGSDAHRPEDIAVGIEAGYAMLHRVGFREITWYENRCPVTAPLELPNGKLLQ